MLCDKAKNQLLQLQQEIPFQMKEVDIASSDELTEKYGLMIPVVEMEQDIISYGQLDLLLIRKRLQL